MVTPGKEYRQATRLPDMSEMGLVTACRAMDYKPWRPPFRPEIKLSYGLFVT